MFTFPTPSDNLPAFLSLPGSFWPGLYGGANLVFDYLRGCQEIQKQLDADINELVAVTARETCPIFHTENWYFVDIVESEGVQATLPATDVTYSVPEELREVHVAVDALTTTSAALVSGVDFTLGSGEIVFVTNPFTNPALTPEPVLNDLGAQVDRKLRLWFVKAQLEREFLEQQFGYVIDLHLPSSRTYRDAIDAIMDAITGGTSYGDIARLIEAATDIQHCHVDGEEVELITADAQHTLIITDSSVYRYELSATPIVSVGQILQRFDQLVDSVLIFEPERGSAPNLASVTLDSRFLDPSIAGPLTFSNASTPLVVTLNISGFTKLEWVLGGAPADVTQFFSLLHSKGVAAGATLANYLDIRPQPQPTQPDANSLPATINPMEFLFENALRANCVVLRLETADFGPEALGTDVLRQMLRKILPPHSADLTIIV